jgi:hypothetical protein
VEERPLVYVDELLVPLVLRVLRRAVRLGLDVPGAVLDDLREDGALDVRERDRGVGLGVCNRAQQIRCLKAVLDEMTARARAFSADGFGASKN